MDCTATEEFNSRNNYLFSGHGIAYQEIERYFKWHILQKVNLWSLKRISQYMLPWHLRGNIFSSST